MQGPQRVELEEALKLRAELQRDSIMTMMMMKLTVMIVTERKSEGDSRNQPETKAN